MLKTVLVVLAAVVLVQVTHAQGARYVRGDTVHASSHRRMATRFLIRALSLSPGIASILIDRRSP